MTVTQSLDAASFEKLRNGFRGELIQPGDREYDSSRVVWNAMADRHPALIARCTRVEDVITAVHFAREHDLVIVVRGGGHSVAGFSTCDGGVVIDLSGMRAVEIDPAKRVARVQGGALLDHPLGTGRRDAAGRGGRHSVHRSRRGVLARRRGLLDGQVARRRVHRLGPRDHGRSEAAIDDRLLRE